MTTHRDQLFLDLFTTAMEGGIGYWSQAESYHWYDETNQCDDVRGFYAHIVEIGDGDVEKRHIIDRSVIARGYRLATSAEWRKRLAWSSHQPPLVPTEENDWDFDATDADMIVQLGLLADVVYG